MSLPDRVWGGDTVVQYRVEGRRARHVSPPPRRQRFAGAEWLGGSDLARGIMRANVLEVLIDDVGLGVSEAVFPLAGAKMAVQRVRETCHDERQALAATSSPRPSGTAAFPTRSQEGESSERQPPARQAEPSRNIPAPGHAPEPKQGTADKDQNPPRVLEEISRPPPQAPEAAPTEQAEPAPETQQAGRPPAEPEDRSSSAENRPSAALEPSPTRPEQPEAPTSPEARDGETQRQAPADAQASPPSDAAAPSAGPPPPRPVEPPQGTAADRNARLAFVQRYGPNRQGELIYGWYHQCLDRAGVDQKGMWYLSDEELTYLSRGETDRVRLSMLLSTVRDFAVPPRRVTCYGTARGRNLVIERAE